MSEAVYLKRGVIIEPLVHRWYAWSHLIAPAQRAVNLARRYLPLLKSFAANPGVHAAASGNPELYGGPFLELTAEALPAVRALIERISRREDRWLHFGKDLLSIQQNIRQTETGYSLDHLYDKLPASLGGLMEVTYDFENQPFVRIIEELLYGANGELAAHQEIGLTPSEGVRPFFLNTPRLDESRTLFVNAPFDGAFFDTLSAARCSGVQPREFDAHVLSGENRRRFDALLTPTPPVRTGANFTSDGLRVRYFGHACVLLQTRNTAVLVDPFVAWGPGEGAELTFDDLPDFIDAVFLTHNHQDHFNPELLLQLRGRVGAFYVPRNNPGNIADPSMKLILRQLGFNNTRILDPMEKVAIDDGVMISLPFLGEHADLSILSKHALFIELLGNRFLFLADSDCKDRALYRRLAEMLGPVENIFIGMECHGAPLSWLYGAYLTKPLSRSNDESRRLSGSDSTHAWQIIEEFSGRNVFVYAMGQERWMRFVTGIEYSPDSKQILESNLLVDRCRAAGLQAQRLNGARTIHFSAVQAFPRREVAAQ